MANVKKDLKSGSVKKTMAEKIAELDDLLKKGEITQDEYKDEKNKIIMEG